MLSILPVRYLITLGWVVSGGRDLPGVQMAVIEGEHPNTAIAEYVRRLGADSYIALRAEIVK